MAGPIDNPFQRIPTGSTGGGGGGAAGQAIATGLGASGLTPLNVSARFAKCKHLNVVTLRAGKWETYDVEVPTILTPQHAVESILLYTPHSQARDTNLVLGAPPLSYTNMTFQTSVGSGVVYLPSPGRWLVYNPGSLDVSMIMVDATDPAVAVRYMSEPGNHGVNTSRSITVAASPTVTTIFSANRYRTGIILQNTHATNGLRVAFGPDNPATGGAPPQGLLLAALGTLIFTGTTLCRGALRVMSTAANGAYEAWEIY